MSDTKAYGGFLPLLQLLPTYSTVAIGLIAAAAYLWARRTLRVPQALCDIAVVDVPRYLWHVMLGAGFNDLYDMFIKERIEETGLVRAWIGEYGWVVHVGSPELAQIICQNHNIFEKLLPKDSLPDSITTSYFGENVLVSNSQEWRLYRKIINPIFRKSLSVKLFNAKAQKFACKLDEVSGEDIDIWIWLQRLTMDILGRAALDYDFDAIDNPDLAVAQIFNRIVAALVNPFWRLASAFDRPWNPLRRSVHQDIDRINDIFYKMIREKRAKLQSCRAAKKGDCDNGNNGSKEQPASAYGSGDDLLSLMIEACEDDNAMLTDKELRDNLAAFFLAGHDTTATSMATVIYYLARYPDAQQRVREEVYRVIGDEQPTAEHFHKLKYTNAVIREALRLVPPVGHLPPRRLNRTFTLGGHTFPKGTLFTLNIWAVQHHSAYWPNPEQFMPERHLDAPDLPLSPGETSDKHAGPQHPNAWLAFSAGSRVCPGYNFSLAEQRVTLALLVRHFSWKLPEDSPHSERLQLTTPFFLKPKDLRIRFQRINNTLFEQHITVTSTTKESTICDFGRNPSAV